MDQIVSDILKLIDANVLEAFEERAGIMEFDAGMPRAHAECLALLDTLRRYPEALSGLAAGRSAVTASTGAVMVLQVGGRGSTRWAIVTDAVHARKQLAAVGLIEIGTADLSTVIKHQFGGAALLSPLD